MKYLLTLFAVMLSMPCAIANDALWNTPSAEVIRFTDYSNFSPVLNNTIKK